uniref:Uncharacterized protein n=1 Tax=Anopheles atroparvus TaxID=41427 RepID=A0A182IKY6_ANOAO
MANEETNERAVQQRRSPARASPARKRLLESSRGCYEKGKGKAGGEERVRPVALRRPHHLRAGRQHLADPPHRRLVGCAGCGAQRNQTSQADRFLLLLALVVCVAGCVRRQLHRAAPGCGRQQADDVHRQAADLADVLHQAQAQLPRHLLRQIDAVGRFFGGGRLVATRLVQRTDEAHVPLLPLRRHLAPQPPAGRTVVALHEVVAQHAELPRAQMYRLHGEPLRVPLARRQRGQLLGEHLLHAVEPRQQPHERERVRALQVAGAGHHLRDGGLILCLLRVRHRRPDPPHRRVVVRDRLRAQGRQRVTARALLAPGPGRRIRRVVGARRRAEVRRQQLDDAPDRGQHRADVVPHQIVVRGRGRLQLVQLLVFRLRLQLLLVRRPEADRLHRRRFRRACRRSSYHHTLLLPRRQLRMLLLLLQVRAAPPAAPALLLRLLELAPQVVELAGERRQRLAQVAPAAPHQRVVLGAALLVVVRQQQIVDAALHHRQLLVGRLQLGVQPPQQRPVRVQVRPAALRRPAVALGETEPAGILVRAGRQHLADPLHRRLVDRARCGAQRQQPHQAARLLLDLVHDAGHGHRRAELRAAGGRQQADDRHRPAADFADVLHQAAPGAQHHARQVEVHVALVAGGGHRLLLLARRRQLEVPQPPAGRAVLLAHETVPQVAQQPRQVLQLVRKVGQVVRLRLQAGGGAAQRGLQAPLQPGQQLGEHLLRVAEPRQQPHERHRVRRPALADARRHLRDDGVRVRLGRARDRRPDPLQRRPVVRDRLRAQRHQRVAVGATLAAPRPRVGRKSHTNGRKLAGSSSMMRRIADSTEQTSRTSSCCGGGGGGAGCAVVWWWVLPFATTAPSGAVGSCSVGGAAGKDVLPAASALHVAFGLMPPAVAPPVCNGCACCCCWLWWVLSWLFVPKPISRPGPTITPGVLLMTAPPGAGC